MRDTEIEVQLLCKTKEFWKPVTKTKKQRNNENYNWKKLQWEKNINCKQVWIAMKSVSGGARCLWRAGFEKEKSFEIGMK